MPELNFKGKEFVYNHHLTVPFRPLEPQADKGIGEPSLDGNLIIHGDNLHGLKALMPMYAGKVDCIFIDPPYNTGNEGWAYNDNVNSPMIREWLEANPIGIEDGLRHDKWACMMWPRLSLLHELLKEGGSIWITLDNVEIALLRLMMDEIFGAENFVTQVEWQKRYTRSNNTNDFTSVIDHILVYQKDTSFQVNLVKRDDQADDRYSNPDNDPRGPWKATPFLNQVPPEKRPNLVYEIQNPNTGETVLPTTKAWRNDRTVYERLLSEGRFWWGKDGKKSVPDIKTYLSEVKAGLAPINFWPHDFAGNTDNANSELKAIFGDKVFDTPKPVKLVRRIIEHATDSEALILDSFAGSGTTAQAVLEANLADGGKRRFILVEGEGYADELTAERVRRVVNGYSFKGTQREELLREPITFTKLRNANTLLEKVQKIETLDSDKYERIKSTVKDGVLIVTGERDCKETAPGLGGTFTYCTLGDPIDMDGLLTGDDLPEPHPLAALLYHTATSQAFDASQLVAAPDIGEGVHRLGTANGRHLWLFYKPDLDWLKSGEAALTLSKARAIAETEEGEHLVFAPAKFVSRDLLKSQNIRVEYAPLPYALYRVETA